MNNFLRSAKYSNQPHQNASASIIAISIFLFNNKYSYMKKSLKLLGVVLLLVFNSVLHAQVITEGFGENSTGGWTVATSSTMGFGTVAGASVPGAGGTTNSLWYSNAIATTGAATSNYKTAAPGIFLGATSSAFVCTPFLTGGVTVVTIAVYPTSSTTRMGIGINTVSSASPTSGQIASSVSTQAAGAVGVNGNWSIQLFSAGVNMVSGQWNTITFTTNLTQGAYLKFQRNNSGSMYIDDISVYGAPTVTTPPASATVCGGGINSQTFSAVFSGLPTSPTYQWQYNTGSSWTNTTDGSSGADYFTGSTSASLTINNITSSNGWQFRCIAMSTTTTTAATLTVNAATSISSPTADASVSYSSGASATPLSVTAAGTGTLTYQWYSNTSGSTSSGTQTTISSATSSTYTPSTTGSSGIYYYCKVTGTCGTATSHQTQINICNAPSFNTQPTDNQSECAGTGSPLSLSVAATLSTYQWYSNTSKSNTGGTSLGSGSNGEQTASYTPPSSTAGTFYYYVVASNGSCTQASNAVQVTVNSATIGTITGPSTSAASYSVGSTVTPLSVSVVGTGLTYQWYSNSSNSNSGGTSISGATSNSYTPSNPTPGLVSNSYYYCIVTTACSSSATSSVSGQITFYPYASGDLGSIANGNWGTASTWAAWNGTAFAGTSSVPGFSSNVWIVNGNTVTLTSGTSSTPVQCGNLHILNGSLESTAAVNTPFYLQVNGNILDVESGSSIGTSVNGDLASGVAIYINNTSNGSTGTTITGGGTIDLSKLLMGSSTSASSPSTTAVTIDNNLTVHYHGSTNNGVGQAMGVIGFTTFANTATITINSGKTVTFDQLSGFILGSSANSNYQVNLTLNVNGTMNFTRGKPAGEAALASSNGTFVLNAASGYAATVNINGTVNATEFFPNGVSAVYPTNSGLQPPGSGSVSTITITSPGALYIDSFQGFWTDCNWYRYFPDK